jgi:hypothetical protein
MSRIKLKGPITVSTILSEELCQVLGVYVNGDGTNACDAVNQTRGGVAAWPTVYILAGGRQSSLELPAVVVQDGVKLSVSGTGVKAWVLFREGGPF